MAKKYLDYDGLLYFWQKIKILFVTDVSYNSTSKKIQKTKAGATSDVVTLSTVATSGSYNDLSNKPTIPAGVEKTTTTPKMDGTAAIGSEVKFAAGDHVHPTDTSRAPLASPAFTGTPTAPTAAANTDSTQIATTAFVHDVVDALDTGVSDVKVDNVSVVTNGVADIPTANIASQKGVVGVGVTAISDSSGTDGSYNTIELKYESESGTALSTTLATTELATTKKRGLMDAEDKTKLNGIASGAEVNQNAFSNVKVGSTTVAADAKTDTLELVAGNNVTITPDATNDKITIAATDTTYSVVTAGSSTTDGGLMSQADKTKLNGIATGAEVNQNAFSNVKVGSTTVAADAKTDTLELVAGSNVTLTPDATNDKVTIAATDTTYSNATTSTAGLMSASDKQKLDDIPTNTLDLVAGTNVTITPNTSTGALTIAATDTTYPTGTANELNTGTGTSTRVWTPKVIADYVTGKISTAVTGVASFQGTAPTSFAPTGYKKGYYWIVDTAGTYAGQVCEPGDMIFAVEDYSSAYSASDFAVIQTNLDITSITNAEIDTIVAS